MRYDANPSLSAQPQVFSTGALNLTSSRYTEGGYGGVPAAHQYYSDPPYFPFATDAAFNGTDIFAARSTSYTNGQAIANNPVYMPVSNNPIVPLDTGLMTEDPFALSPNIYTTGQASANYPFSMLASNNSIVPMNDGFTTGGPFAVPPNIYTPGQASANSPLPVPMSNSALILVDIGPPVPQRPLCTQCNQPFSRQSDLDRHAKKHQPGPKEFKCNVQGCKYESHRKDKLREHVRRRHPGMGVA